MKIMKSVAWPLAFVAVGFFGLIGFAVWYTESAYPLFALLILGLMGGVEVEIK